MRTWTEILKNEFEQPYFKDISTELSKAYETSEIFPPKNEVFSAFDFCPLDKTKVVLLGMDPYHGKGQAHGLSFSVKPDVKIPPSLKNIFKEIHSDLGIAIPNNGYLKSWANQGVLLLNSALTVRSGEPGSHIKLWEPFTKNIIKILNEQERPIVFLLWGAFARGKRYLINNDLHLILECAHPSPLSAYNGFFGCKHFSATNKFLQSHNLQPIDWSIT
jgi:uracil-DNA glycosylase